VIATATAATMSAEYRTNIVFMRHWYPVAPKKCEQRDSAAPARLRGDRFWPRNVTAYFDVGERSLRDCPELNNFSPTFRDEERDRTLRTGV